MNSFLDCQQPSEMIQTSSFPQCKSHMVWKYDMENSRNIQPRSFKLHTIPSCMMESCATPLCHNWMMIIPFPACQHSTQHTLVSHLVAGSYQTNLGRDPALVVQVSLLFLRMTLQCKRGDVDNLKLPKKAIKGLLQVMVSTSLYVKKNSPWFY